MCPIQGIISRFKANRNCLFAGFGLILVLLTGIASGETAKEEESFLGGHWSMGVKIREQEGDVVSLLTFEDEVGSRNPCSAKLA
jgi:hypothetical protein